MLIREHQVELGWEAARPLSLLLVQPRFGIETDADQMGRIGASWRQKQNRLVEAIARLLKEPKKHIPAPYLPVHVIALPEFAVPCDTVTQLLKAVARASHPVLLFAGIERQTVADYRSVVAAHMKPDDCRDRELGLLPADNPDPIWVNAAVIAWHDHEGGTGTLFQRKISPSRWERDSLCLGDCLHVIRASGVRLVLTLCSDMLNASSPAEGCPVAASLVQQCSRDYLGAVDAIVHLQFNEKPDDDLMTAGFKTLLVDSSVAAGEKLRGATVIRVNAASETELSDSYGLTGVLVGGHRRYPPQGPLCSCRRLGDIVRYDMRPRRASAFLVQLYLASRIPGPEAKAGKQPVTDALWLGLRAQTDVLDFRPRTRAVVPEGYRFAAWKAFPCIPGGPFPVGGQDAGGLGLRLNAKYAELRKMVWAEAGRCLARWGKEVFRLVRLDNPAKWEADVRSCPDDWGEAERTSLRRLARGLAMIHAAIPVSPAPADVGSAVRLSPGMRSIHCRVMPETRADIAVLVKEDFDLAETGAVRDDLYLVTGGLAPSPMPETVKVADLTSGGPVYGAETNERRATDQVVKVVDVGALERAAYPNGKPIDADELPSVIENIVKPSQTEEGGG